MQGAQTGILKSQSENSAFYLGNHWYMEIYGKFVLQVGNFRDFVKNIENVIFFIISDIYLYTNTEYQYLVFTIDD